MSVAIMFAPKEKNVKTPERAKYLEE